MSSASQQPVYLLGPTAVGKSGIAVAVAERMEGEVVGADAFQVYRGLDLLTAKPGADLLQRVPHHLIGEIPLSETFDVARYAKLASERIAEIQGRGRVPVVVGGTGLYVRALTHGLAELPPADATLRAELEKSPLEELVRRFEALDPVGAASIDRQNPRRVIRALEVCLVTGRPFSSFRQQNEPKESVRGVVILRPREDLYTGIDRRTCEMFASGVVDEVRALGPVSATAEQAMGLREIRSLIAGEISEPECIARIQQQTRNYAKRQLTWFRREAHFTPVTIDAGESVEQAAERVVEAVST